MKFYSFIIMLALPILAFAENIDLSTPEGVVQANRKIQCSTIDKKPVFYSWEGRAYSRRQGEADKLLFKLSGMNVRQCVTLNDPKRGKGYKYTAREIMLYLDPKTGKVLDKWHNPFLGRDVDVFQVANDPVNQRPVFPYSADGKPTARWWGRELLGSWFMNVTFPLFYHNVLQGDYQKFVGGAYHAEEMFNFMGEMDDLLDKSKDTAGVKVGWVRMAEWLPWMEMQGREGLVYMHAAGKKIGSFDDLPDVMKNYINSKKPLYKAPPAAGDKRPNATSWSVFRDAVAGEKLPRGGH